MAVKLLEILIGKIQSMNLAVLGAIGNFYAMQLALNRSRAFNRTTEYLSNQFH